MNPRRRKRHRRNPNEAYTPRAPKAPRPVDHAADSRTAPYWLPGYGTAQHTEALEALKKSDPELYNTRFKREVGFSGPLIPLSYK